MTPPKIHNYFINMQEHNYKWHRQTQINITTHENKETKTLYSKVYGSWLDGYPLNREVPVLVPKQWNAFLQSSPSQTEQYCFTECQQTAGSLGVVQINKLIQTWMSHSEDGTANQINAIWPSTYVRPAASSRSSGRQLMTTGLRLDEQETGRAAVHIISNTIFNTIFITRFEEDRCYSCLWII